MTDVKFVYREKSITAMLFEPEQPPYVVKKKQGAAGFPREVPWREGTSISSIKRSDLFKLLIPSITTPKVEVVEARLVDKAEAHTRYCHLSLECTLFVIQPASQSSVFSGHRINVTAKTQADEVYNIENIRCKSDSGAVALNGPGSFAFEGEYQTPEHMDDDTGPNPFENVELSITLRIPNCDEKVRVSCLLNVNNDEFNPDRSCWTYQFWRDE